MILKYIRYIQYMSNCPIDDPTENIFYVRNVDEAVCRFINDRKLPHEAWKVCESRFPSYVPNDMRLFLRSVTIYYYD